VKYYVLGLSAILLAACSNQETLKENTKNAVASDKIQTCIACHGADGKVGKPGVPPLAGRSHEELVAAMERVREAYSPQPLLGHQLNDDDIRLIADYFSAVN
jgi:cytochrome c553